MKSTLIITALLLVSFTSYANVYKCEKNGVVNFTDQPCPNENGENIPYLITPKYITFKWGSSACRNIKHWQKAIDNVAAKRPSPLNVLDINCDYLREDSVVFGPLKSVKYKNTEFVKVKASNSFEYWIELPAVLPITSERVEKPQHWYTGIRTF